MNGLSDLWTLTIWKISETEFINLLKWGDFEIWADFCETTVFRTLNLVPVRSTRDTEWSHRVVDAWVFMNPRAYFIKLDQDLSLDPEKF